MSGFETVQLVEAYRQKCEDRLGVFEAGTRTIIVVADGAGGTGSGDLAADQVVGEIRNVYKQVSTAQQWHSELQQIDFRIAIGESTAVVVDLSPERTIGASVGDSCAWIVNDGSIIDLTAQQIRKPLLGSRDANARAFECGPLRGTLLVASDGFFDHVKRDEISPIVARTDFYALPRTLIERVRLPSGQLWDDVGVVCCRTRRPAKTRKRFTLLCITDYLAALQFRQD